MEYRPHLRLNAEGEQLGIESRPTPHSKAPASTFASDVSFNFANLLWHRSRFIDSACFARRWSQDRNVTGNSSAVFVRGTGRHTNAVPRCDGFRSYCGPLIDKQLKVVINSND